MRARLIALALAGATLPATSALAATPSRTVTVPGSFGIQLLDTAAQAIHNPLARTYIVSALAPGSSTSRIVEVSNTTHSTADVAVYSAAASFHHSIFVFASGHGQDTLSRWTSLSQSTLRVPPGGHAFDTVAINVPRLASAGEQYAVVWAQMAAPSRTKGVTLVNRVGIRMYVSIGHGGLPPANFAVGSLSARRSVRGQPLIRANVHNSGQRTIVISGDLTLTDGPGGLRAGPFPVRLGAALAPGDSAPLIVTLNKVLPPGPWRAEIRLTDGALERTTEATIRFPSEG